MGKLQVNGDISATGTISISKILGTSNTHGLLVQSNGTNPAPFGEGIYVLPSTYSGYGVIAAGKLDKTSGVALVYNSDGYKHYIELINPNGRWKNYIPEGGGTFLTTYNTYNYNLCHKYFSATTDFNTIISTSWNSIQATSTNSPTPANHGLMLSEFDVGTPFQIWYPDNTMAIYKRWRSGDTWTDWSNTWAINISGTAATASAVAWNGITGKPSSFTPASHTHNTLTFGGEGGTASVRTADYTSTVLTGGWASSKVGYGWTHGTTLDISGYSTWYHRLAFRTDGNIEYWQGINTKTMSKVGNLCFTDHSHSYLPLSGGTMSGQLSININSPGTSPSTQHIILNGQNGSSAVANAPGLAMHIGNMNWSTLKFLSDGSWRFYNSECNGYMPIYCSKTIVTNYGSSLPSSGATGEIFYKT